jgi:hypothetical protein
MKKDKLMTGIFHASYLMGALLIIVETFRRGFEHWGVYATTIIEDYIAGAFLIIAAVLWIKKSPRARMVMAAAWAYMIGMMTPTFFGHFEAYLRGATILADAPYDAVAAIVIKGLLWLIAVIGLGLTLYIADSNNKAGEKQ